MARQMKDSGVEWIGEIPENWEVTKLKHFISGYKAGPFGSALITDKLNPKGNLLVYTPEHIAKNTADLDGNLYLPDERFEEMQQFLIATGDIIFPIVGSLGRSMLITEDMPAGIINQRLAKFRVDTTQLSIEYFLWLFSKSTFFNTYIDLNCRGAIIVNLTKQIVCDIPISHPVNFEEQHRIADFLDLRCAEIDAVIDRTKATIEEYKKLKQAIITEAVTKGVRGPRKMKNSGIEWIGEIPEEWTVSSIKYGVTKVGSGKTPLGGAESYADNGILFLRSQNVHDTGLVLDSPTFITDDVDAEMSNTRVRPGDVLLNITGASIGRCCVFPVEYQRANVNQHVCIIRVIQDTFMSEFMHYYWVSALGHTVIDLYQTGGNREGMSADAIKNAPIIYMSMEEQSQIVSYLDEKCSALDTLIAKKTALLTELETYKKSLIYEYVTGKKEVG